MVISLNIGHDGEPISHSLLVKPCLTCIQRSDNDMYDHMNNSIYNFL